MKKKFLLLTAALAAFLSCSGNARAESSGMPMAELCRTCHQAEPGVMLGFLEDIAPESRLIQLDFISHQEIIKFNDDTTLRNITSFAELGNYRRSGFKVNFSEINHEKLATEIIRFDLLSTLAPAERLEKDDLKKIITNPEVRTYQVKSPTESMMGHLPGAMPMPAPLFENAAANLPEDRETPIVLSGTGDCLSHAAFTKLRSLGYKNVQVYVGGYADWSATEYVMIDIAWLKQAIAQGLPHVLIDLRPAQEIVNGHIKGAIAIAVNDLDKYRAQFPPQKDAPIIFYGPGSRQAATKVISWGYRAVGVMPASFAGWQAIGNPVSLGPAQSRITFSPTARPGTIPAPEFARLSALRDETHLLIDVREPYELLNGALPGAINIPLTELPARPLDLQTGQELIFFSNKGRRAAMAYNLLKGLIPGARYLDGELSFSGEAVTILENRR